MTIYAYILANFLYAQLIFAVTIVFVMICVLQIFPFYIGRTCFMSCLSPQQMYLTIHSFECLKESYCCTYFIFCFLFFTYSFFQFCPCFVECVSCPIYLKIGILISISSVLCLLIDHLYRYHEEIIFYTNHKRQLYSTYIAEICQFNFSHFKISKKFLYFPFCLQRLCKYFHIEFPEWSRRQLSRYIIHSLIKMKSILIYSVTFSLFHFLSHFVLFSMTSPQFVKIGSNSIIITFLFIFVHVLIFIFLFVLSLSYILLSQFFD